MPKFVRRDETGKVVEMQDQATASATEELPDDHPDVVNYVQAVDATDGGTQAGGEQASDGAASTDAA